MKICVIGYSGSGKSTLARMLGEKYGLPALHLDATFWYGNWQNRTREEQAVLVDAFIAQNQSWVIDGNYFNICLDRFEVCDKIYFLDYNRIFCFREAKKRYKQYKGQKRPDCPCTEKFDFGFAKWLLWDGRTKKSKRRFKEIMELCKGRVFVFKTRKKLLKHLSEI